MTNDGKDSVDSLCEGFLEMPCSLSVSYSVYFSLLVEMKREVRSTSQKRRRVRKVPTVLSLRILSPYLRASFAEAKEADALSSRSVPKGRGVGDMADHLGQPPFGNNPRFSFTRQDKLRR